MEDQGGAGARASTPRLTDVAPAPRPAGDTGNPGPPTPAPEAVAALDRLARLAGRLLDSPYAWVVLTGDGPPGAESAARWHAAQPAVCRQVLDTGALVLVEDADVDPRTRDLPAHLLAGARAWVAVPVLGPAGELAGSFCVVDPRPRTWAAQDVEALLVLADAAATRLAHDAAVQQARTARAQVDVLSDASALLLSDLDPDAVLQRLTGLAVPGLARWCGAWLPTGDGRLRAAAVAGPDGQQWPYPHVAIDGPSPSARAYRTRRPQQVADLTAALQQAMPDDPVMASMAAAGAGAAYSVPLLVHGRVLGAWTLIRHRDDAPFTDADRSLAGHLAGRAGQALSLAQQHAGQRDAARVLQHSLLPRLPDVSGLSVRACYRPAGGTEVGGDWFDLLALPCGRVALVIGDVMGRGIPAAAVMGQVRSATRAYARMSLPPAQVLGLLEETVAELTSAGQDSPLVTCFLAVHDPRARTLTWASAGHLPPIARGTGPAASLSGPVGTPLGVGHGTYVDTVTALDAGTLLVMFTDGLVEDRRRDLDVGLDLVRTLVDRADPADLDGLAELLLAHVAAEEEDDVALLLVRTS